MQQTETYKLNLIEKTDTFSPDPLNENTDKLETQLARLDGADAALAQRVTVLEARHIAFGHYTPAAGAIDIILGFNPKIVIIATSVRISTFCGTLVAEQSRGDVSLIPGGFQVAASQDTGLLNKRNETFGYIAFG